MNTSNLFIPFLYPYLTLFLPSKKLSFTFCNFLKNKIVDIVSVILCIALYYLKYVPITLVEDLKDYAF